MAKVLRGRISGLHGMETHTVEELYAHADQFELRSLDPNDPDDSNWLKQWAKNYRSLAEQKERAREHKTVRQKKGHRPDSSIYDDLQI